jgi:glycosyltransferase involved in cell wall biosynthesis
MGQADLVSVIIPVYNGERFLRPAVESVVEQTYRPLEVIVVNDGSTDSSEQILEEYAGRIRYFRQENAGRAAARNRGVDEARGEWVAFQDADDLWDPGKLEAQMEVVQHEDTVVDCSMRVIDGAGNLIRQDIRLPRPPWPTMVDWIFNCQVSMTAVARRRAIQAVGGFDPANRSGTDDYQLWLALVATGHKFRFVERPLASYRWHGENASTDLLRVFRGTIYAIERTRWKYPDAFGRAEIKAYRERLSDLHSRIAMILRGRGDQVGASKHLIEAFRHRPTILKTWGREVIRSLPFGDTILRNVQRLRRATLRKGA